MPISDIRKRIDAIDQQLVALFKDRMAASAEIAAFKRQSGLPIFDPAREKALLKGVMAQAGPDLAIPAKMLFTSLMAISRARQAELLQSNDADMEALRAAVAESPSHAYFPESAVVACQGTEGAYSAKAAERFFKNPDVSFCPQFENVFQAVEEGRCDFGVLPVENSTAGSVTKVYDLMRKYRFYIVRSCRLRVEHALLALPGTKIEDIREVVSHEQAIAQCAGFFRAHPEARPRTVANTAVAASQVATAGRRDFAALASADCADIYGLVPLVTAVQDSAYNLTRFICITKNLEIYPGATRTSFTITLPHRPGSLYSVMSLLSAYDINVQKLESRPLPGSDFAFQFYFDVDAAPAAPYFLPLVQSVKSFAERFYYIGSYTEIA